MLDAISIGLGTLFTPAVLVYVLIGAIMGITIGAVPAIGGIVLMALLLPFLLGIPPEMAIGLLVALVAVCETGGSMTSILLNVPGMGLNAATIIDGFPMTLPKLSHSSSVKTAMAHHLSSPWQR